MDFLTMQSLWLLIQYWNTNGWTSLCVLYLRSCKSWIICLCYSISGMSCTDFTWSTDRPSDRQWGVWDRPLCVLWFGPGTRLLNIAIPYLYDCLSMEHVEVDKVQKGKHISTDSGVFSLLWNLQLLVNLFVDNLTLLYYLTIEEITVVETFPI